MKHHISYIHYHQHIDGKCNPAIQDFRYNRDDWLESRTAEKALIRHRRVVALLSY